MRKPRTLHSAWGEEELAYDMREALSLVVVTEGWDTSLSSVYVTIHENQIYSGIKFRCRCDAGMRFSNMRTSDLYRVDIR